MQGDSTNKYRCSDGNKSGTKGLGASKMWREDSDLICYDSESLRGAGD